MLNFIKIEQSTLRMLNFRYFSMILGKMMMFVQKSTLKKIKECHHRSSSSSSSMQYNEIN
jgi:hypothetical protein